jgi:hypothetical protein
MKIELNIKDNSPNQIMISEMPVQINISGIRFESVDKEKIKEGAQGKCLKYAQEVANKNPNVEIIHGAIVTVNKDNSGHVMAHAWNRSGEVHFDVTAENVWKRFDEKPKEVRYATIESYSADEQPLNFSASVLQIVDELNAVLSRREDN